jgi:hypothetical protein
MDKEDIKRILLSINREGMQSLVNELETLGYFDSPASTKYHLSCPGGLIKHSRSVAILFKKLEKNISKESITLVSLLPDVCKAGAYIKNNDSTYRWNMKQPKGHSKLSLDIIEKHIKLTDLERTLIKYHMGMYGTYEFAGPEKGEYTLQELTINYNTNKLAKLFYFCDDMSSQFLEE